MSAHEQDEASAAFCANLVRVSDFERYAAALFVPPAQRRSLLALHAFDIEVSRVRDHVSQPLAGEIRLQWWADVLQGAARGDAERSPVAAELLRAIGQDASVIDGLDRHIETHRFDLYDEPMPTMVGLENYLQNTVSVLFGLGARMSGYVLRGESELLRVAGLAKGLVSTIAALPRHASRRQLYLPLEMIDRFGVRPGDLFSGTSTPELHGLLVSLCDEARVHLGHAITMLEHEPLAARRVFLVLSLTEQKLRRIEQPAYDPFRSSIAQSNLATLWTLWRATHRAPFKS